VEVHVAWYQTVAEREYVPPGWSFEVSVYVYVQAPLSAGAGLLPQASSYGTPGPGQVTLPPSPVDHTTFTGVATIVADTAPPGTVAVVPVAWYALGFRYTYVGKFVTAAAVSGGDAPKLGGVQETCERAHRPSTLAAVGGVLRVPTVNTPTTVGSGQKTTPIDRYGGVPTSGGAWESIHAMTELYSAASSQGHDEAGGAVSPYIQVTALIPCFQVQSPALPVPGVGVDVGSPTVHPGPPSALQVAVGLGEGSVSAHAETTGPLSEARAANSRPTAKARRAAPAARLSIRCNFHTPS
jgi:hypothetical protein